MNQKSNKIQLEVEKTLNLLDHGKINDVNVNPYFYTKLSERINDLPNTGSLINSFYDLFKKAYLVPAAMVILMLINVFTFYYVKDGSTVNTESSESSIDTFIETYELKGN